MAAPPGEHHSRSVSPLYIRATALACTAVMHPRTRRPTPHLLSLRYICAGAGMARALAAAPAHHICYTAHAAAQEIQNRCPSAPRAWHEGAILRCTRPPDHPRLSIALCVQCPPDSSNGDGRQAPDLLSSMHPARRPDSSKELTVSDVCFFLQVRMRHLQLAGRAAVLGAPERMLWADHVYASRSHRWFCWAWEPGTEPWKAPGLAAGARGSSGPRRGSSEARRT
jgi:hypothetical protein